MANGHGGKRNGAGRKPSQFNELKHRIESEQVDDAEYAFALYSAVMRDPEQLLRVRLGCADWIANRVMGKPKEQIEHSGEIAVKAYVGINPDEWDSPAN